MSEENTSKQPILSYSLLRAKLQTGYIRFFHTTSSRQRRIIEGCVGSSNCKPWREGRAL